jgi:hypothetical protein
VKQPEGQLADTELAFVIIETYLDFAQERGRAGESGAATSGRKGPGCGFDLGISQWSEKRYAGEMREVSTQGRLLEDSLLKRMRRAGKIANGPAELAQDVGWRRWKVMPLT